ncbi:unnamed protein product [Bursaphelenchus xylophilus]|uniref:(pine wood nematode) hypothetical protein n=1 Tax=Bursaphelenchus xylophilus TaxID=6326 RepID=A0A1I7S4B1_BURXY|nr:unnamed protein product [Bursaphelenchus xylophilus]CAG9116908.1 unnamed protein product [Bursaphelenchus xylophilus]
MESFKLAASCALGICGVVSSTLLIRTLLGSKSLRKRDILRTIALTNIAENIYCISYCIPIWAWLFCGHVFAEETTQIIAFINEVTYKAQIYQHTLLEVTRLYYTFRTRKKTPLASTITNDIFLFLCWVISVATIAVYFSYGRTVYYDYVYLEWLGENKWNTPIRIFYVCQWVALYAGLGSAIAVLIAFWKKMPNTKNMKKTIEGKIFLQTIFLSLLDGLQIMISVISANGLKSGIANILALTRCSMSAPFYIFLNREIRTMICSSTSTVNTSQGRQSTAVFFLQTN